MSTDTPTPERVTLTDRERAQITRCLDDHGGVCREVMCDESLDEAVRRILVGRLEAQLAEVRRTSRILPCDGLCSEYAEEDCSLHGREPAELWEAIDAKNARAEKAEAERDAAREALARAEALADEWERNYASMLVGGFSGCSIAADSAAKRIRAALQPATARDSITIPTPTISTGPTGMTEAEAAEDYLREMRKRTGLLQAGSGVTALVDRLLDDVLAALAVVNAQPATDEGAGA